MRGAGNADSRPMSWDPSLQLQEMWVQKTFSDAANLKIGLIGTPVGHQDNYPTDFFSVIRPENNACFLELDNQSPAIDFNGTAGDWDYDVMLIPGFVSYDYGNPDWRLGHSGEESYTQTINRLYAGAFRVDNSSVPGLTLGISGEVGGGHTFIDNDNPDAGGQIELNSTLALGSFDWVYDAYNVVLRGEYQYGYVANSLHKGSPAPTGRIHDMQAMSAGAELGYDMFSLNKKLDRKQKFYIFARYDWSQWQNHEPATDQGAFMTDSQRFSIGVNWFAISSLIFKAEWGMGFGNDPTRTFAGLSVSWQPTFP